MNRLSQVPIEELRKIVMESDTFVSIIRKVGGYKTPHASTDTLKRYLKTHGIDFEHIPCGPRASVGRLYFATPCLDPNEVLVANSKYGGHTARRAVVRGNLVEYVCAICRRGPEWMGKPMTLRLDHIDGNNRNHQLANLRFVCPNCDSQLSTYCGRNVRRTPGLCGKCGVAISKWSESGLCAKCAMRASPNRVVSRMPDRAVLMDKVWRMPSEQIAVEYGVSGQTITKWCRKYGISKPGLGYWSRLNVRLIPSQLDEP